VAVDAHGGDVCSVWCVECDWFFSVTVVKYPGFGGGAFDFLCGNTTSVVSIRKDLKCVVRRRLSSVLIEFPRMWISVNLRNCTYAFPRMCISTYLLRLHSIAEEVTDSVTRISTFYACIQ